ncbi:MAG TPA: hypothetical protein VE570_08135 [Thermoleophilaceae bacterium]|jgi:hypothetical protein|nr:hypothetical protein [Thermoleophilaceae bacterium]
MREILPEVALGIADGEQRALALEHAARCSDCRRELEELASVADDLVALVPPREPPAGFEDRVLGRLGLTHRRRRPARRHLRRLAFAGALAATVAATAIAVSARYSSDRTLAAQYRAALQGADGKYFQSARLQGPGGERAGIVFAYQGSPSWLFYVLDEPYRRGGYKEQIVTRSGRTVNLPPFRLVKGSWGITTPVPLRDIARVKLVREPDGGSFTAALPVVEP